MPRLYGKGHGDKIYEVQNKERSRGDVVVMQALSTQQIKKVSTMRKDGASDTQIWRALHPEQGLECKRNDKTKQFALKLEQLTKAQLILLIETTMKREAHSLQNMTREDLMTLLRAFGKGGKPTRVTLTPG